MYEDSPDDVAMDRFASLLWPDHGYGRSISGSIEQVSAISRDDIYSYWQGNYVPSRCVLSVAGNVTPEQVRQAAEELFPPRSGWEAPRLDIPVNGSGRIIQQKPIEQEHVCMGFPAMPLGDPDIYAANIIANALGGGASSRLFQEVREKRGLAYSAHAFLDNYTKAGVMMAYAATQPDRSEQLIEVMANEFVRLAESGITQDELKRSQEQIRGSLMLSLENTSSVMSRQGQAMLALNQIYDPEDRVKKLMAVTMDDIRRVIDRMLQPGAMILSQVGPNPCYVDVKELF